LVVQVQGGRETPTNSAWMPALPPTPRTLWKTDNARHTEWLLNRFRQNGVAARWYLRVSDSDLVPCGLSKLKFGLCGLATIQDRLLTI
jgi:hypothetical protein